MGEYLWWEVGEIVGFYGDGRNFYFYFFDFCSGLGEVVRGNCYFFIFWDLGWDGEVGEGRGRFLIGVEFLVIRLIELFFLIFLGIFKKFVDRKK